MDSPIQPTPISSFPPSQSFTPRKLPIKRKTQTLETPQSNHSIISHPRIWSEQDEIQFLQNLLKPSSQTPLSHPFTKSQLSDKLRRLRKKFRNLSEKLDHSLVSPHDRKLYELMTHLWEPQIEPRFHNTNFNESNEANNDHLVAVLALPSVVQKANNVSVGNEVKVRFKVKDDEVKVKVREDGEVVKCGMKALGEVVDESLKMIRDRMMSECESDVGGFSGVGKEVRFEKRWREQRMEEFEVLAKRCKLIMENSSSVCGK